MSSPRSIRAPLVGLCALCALAACAPTVDNFTPTSGPPDTLVTIEGSNYKTAATENVVRFNGTAVPHTDVTPISTSKLTARVPAGATTGPISVTNSNGTGISSTDFTVHPSVKAKWTLLVYLDADNNLEDEGIDDFLEMASVVSNPDVNVVVQMDRIAGYTSQYGDWTGTRRFLIQNGDDPGMTPLADLGEQNMGDPKVLRDFVVWGIKTYPADRYALSIWNHGGGWKEMMEKLVVKARDMPGTTGGVAKAVCSDWSDGDELHMHEVQTALTQALQNSGLGAKLDVVGFDACLMGMAEVAFEIRDCAGYVVASEDSEPGDGWPYDAILGHLVAAPGMSARDLAKTIVKDYAASYPAGSDVTQSAVDTSKLKGLLAAIDAFTAAANTEWAKLKAARLASAQYHPPGFTTCWGTDLWDFANRVKAQVAAPALKTAAQDVKDAVDAFVVSEAHGTANANSHGVAIYFPPTKTEYNADPDHGAYNEANTVHPIDFVDHCKWDNWLVTYYSNIP